MNRTSPWRTAGLVALGYGYIVGLLVVLGIGVYLSATAVGPWRLLGWRLGVPLFGSLFLLVLSSVAIRFSPQEGRRVTRDEAPGLFAALELAQIRTGAPPIHVVVLTPEFNASVSEVPRFGYLGPAVRTLAVGLPLLESLGPSEALGVVAHECAHLRFRHVARAAWLVRLNAGWWSLVATLEARRHPGAWLLRPFFHWYAPRFESLVQERSRYAEFDSDRLAAEAVGPDVVARGLLRLHVMSRVLERGFWRTLRATSREQRDPPEGVFAALAEALRQPLDPAHLGEQVAAALGERAAADHSHPGLAERLRALGMLAADDGAPAAVAALEIRESASAAAAWFTATNLPRVRRDLDWEWRLAIGSTWRGWHHDAVAAEFGQPMDGRDGGADDGAEVAAGRWAAACAPVEVALPLLERLVARHPDRIDLALALGSLELSGPGPGRVAAGITRLEKVLASRSTLVLNAAALLEPEYLARGDESAAGHCRARRQAVRRSAMAALGERFVLRADDRISAARASPSVLAVLGAELGRHPEVERAYLIAKHLDGLEDDPVTVLVIAVRVPWYRFEPTGLDRTATAVTEGAAPRMTEDLVVFPAARRGRLVRRLARLPGALVFQDGSAVVERPIRPGESVGGGLRARLARVGSTWPLLVGAALVAVWVALPSSEPTLANQEARVRRHPEDAAAHNDYGWELAQQDRLDSALAEFDRARRLDPSDVGAQHNYAWVLAGLGRHREAVIEFRQAIRLDPKSAGLRADYARSLLALGDGREARDQSYKGVALAPYGWWPLTAAAEVAMARGRHADCLAFLRRATEQAPDRPELWAFRAAAAYFTNRHEEAAWAVDQARRLDSAIVRRPGLFFDLAEVVRSLEQEGIFASIARKPPAITPFTAEDRERDRVAERANDMRDSVRLASAAAVVRIRFRPDSVELRVGDSLPTYRIDIWAEDRRGRRIDGFVPLVALLPNAAVVQAGGFLLATRPGYASLRVATRPAGLSADTAGPTASLPIVVRPAPIGAPGTAQSRTP